MTKEILINIIDWGIRLRFQVLSQKLHIIDIYDFSNTTITYVLKGRNIKAGTSFEQVQNVLGPCFPGSFVDSDGKYLLSMDGLSLIFSVPIKYQSHYSSNRAHELPITLPDKSSPLLTRVYIHPSNLKLLELDRYPDFLPDNVTLNVKSSQILLNVTLNNTHKGSSPTIAFLALGMSAQDIISELDCSPNVAEQGGLGGSNSMWNLRLEYHALGLELFLSTLFGLYRVDLHNNLPMHPHFGGTSRCGFVIDLDSGDETCPGTEVTSTAVADIAASASLLSAASPSLSSAVIRCNTHWSEAEIQLQRALLGGAGYDNSSSSISLNFMSPVLETSGPRPAAVKSGGGRGSGGGDGLTSETKDVPPPSKATPTSVKDIAAKFNSSTSGRPPTAATAAATADTTLPSSDSNHHRYPPSSSSRGDSSSSSGSSTGDVLPYAIQAAPLGSPFSSSRLFCFPLKLPSAEVGKGGGGRCVSAANAADPMDAYGRGYLVFEVSEGGWISTVTLMDASKTGACTS